MSFRSRTLAEALRHTLSPGSFICRPSGIVVELILWRGYKAGAVPIQMDLRRPQLRHPRRPHSTHRRLALAAHSQSDLRPSLECRRPRSSAEHRGGRHPLDADPIPHLYRRSAEHASNAVPLHLLACGVGADRIHPARAFHTPAVGGRTAVTAWPSLSERPGPSAPPRPPAVPPHRASRRSFRARS